MLSNTGINTLPSETGANPIRRIREALGFPTQRAFAEALGVVPQHVSRAESRQTMSAHFEKRLRLLLASFAPEIQKKALDLLDARLLFGREALESGETSMDKSAWASPVPDPAEPEVWEWCLSNRNKPLLEETARRALRSGLSCVLKHDGLVISEKAAERTPKQAGGGLWPDPLEFGLHAGTVLVLGVSKRHPLAARLLFHFNELLRPRVEIKEFLEHPYRYAYFGYPTVLKYLFVDGNYHRPDRYAERETMVYKDVVAIFHAPFTQLSGNYAQVYGGEAKRLIWVASLQRLGNGVAVRLVSDAGFRKSWANCLSLSPDFESDRAAGAVILEVTVANDGYGTTLREIDLVKVLKPLAGRRN